MVKNFRSTFLPQPISITISSCGLQAVDGFLDEILVGNPIEDRENFPELLMELAFDILEDSFYRLSPLMERRPFKLTLTLGLEGLADGESKCHRDFDYPNEVFFNMGIPWLEGITNAHYFPDLDDYAYYRYLMDRQLIRALDMPERTLGETSWKNSELKDYFLGWLLTYRAEGLAELPLFLRGTRAERDFGQAKVFLAEKLAEKKNFNWEATYADEVRWEFFDQEPPSKRISPLMVLHALYLRALDKGDQYLASLAVRGMTDEWMEERSVNKLIEAGLRLANEEFLHCLTRKGYFGEEFVEADLLEGLFIRMENAVYIPEWRPDPEEREEMVGTDPVSELWENEDYELDAGDWQECEDFSEALFLFHARFDAYRQELRRRWKESSQNAETSVTNGQKGNTG